MKVIGHIPDTMAKVVHGRISECKALQLIVKIDEKNKGAPGPHLVKLNFLLSYLYEGKVHKSGVREKIEQCERNLMFQKTRMFFYLSKHLLIKLFQGWAYPQVGLYADGKAG